LFRQAQVKIRTKVAQRPCFGASGKRAKGLRAEGAKVDALVLVFNIPPYYALRSAEEWEE